MLSLSGTANNPGKDNPGTEAAARRSEMLVSSRETVRELAACLGSLVHESARGDADTLRRHQVFIASHLAVGFLAACVLPVMLVVGGKPSILGAVAFLWLLSPIAIAVFLSRTGRFATAQRISTANLAGLVTFCTWLTGGLSSALLPWFVVIPLEAGLSADRRLVAYGAGASALGLTVLALCGVVGLGPGPFAVPVPVEAFAILGVCTAMIYASGLVMLVQTPKSETGLPAGEARYRQITENVNDMLTQHDEKGRVVLASRAAHSLLGVPARRVLGDGLFERVHVADRPAFLSALSRCRAGRETVVVEFRIRRSSAGRTGAYAWVEMSCSPMLGMVAGGAVCITRDISVHKDREAVLVRARGRAESASLAKTQFLASMSHELRTPLNAIIGFSEILDTELFGAIGEERYRDYARLIHESGVHLLNVVNDILDMSKIEAGKFSILKEPFDAGDLLKSCCDIVRHTADQKSLSLTVEVPGSMPELSADKRACKQMLLNVLSNAVKFTEVGGWVKLAASVEGRDMVFTVSDNGVGIAEQDLPRLGDPFVQTARSYERSYEGAGLGLSVVRGLVGLHGGKLDIASRLGEGTVVRILLPFSPQIKTRSGSSATRAVSAA